MRYFYIALIALASLGTTALSASAADALTGEMAPMNFLLGAPWGCTASVPAIHGMAAHTDHLTVTFDVAPNNVLHDHVAGSNYSGDDYYGYSTRMSNFWTANADSHGMHGFGTSSDGKTYTGTASMGPMTMDVSTTYARTGPNATTMHQVLSGDGRQAAIDSSCTR
jgi:hypothetical protein